MAFSTPRKQTILTASVCIVGIIIVLLYVYGPWGNNSDKKEGLAVTNLPQIPNDQPLATSTNWQKDFYTVSSSTNSAYGVDDPNATTTTEILTNTDIMGREFLIAYSELQKAGKTNDAATVNFVANQVIDNAVARIVPPPEYVISDLNIDPNSDTIALEKYASTLDNILSTKLPKDNEVSIVLDAMDTGDLTLLKKIDPIVAGYKETLAAVITMSVPEAISSYHLKLLNGLSLQTFNSRALRDLELDPVGGLAAINEETNSMEQITSALEQINSELSSRGIIPQQ